jgi:purine-cytosine permease-like protein
MTDVWADMAIASQLRALCRREIQMKSLAALVISFIIVMVVWNVVGHILGSLVSLALSIAAICLFVYAVATVYRMLTKQKQTY